MATVITTTPALPFFVEWEKPRIGASHGINWLIGPDGYRKSYGADSAAAERAAKRKNGKA